MNIKEKKKIMKFLSKYFVDSNGNYMKIDCPTKGYLKLVKDLPTEINLPFNLLKELLNESK
jgi:hypothetical protein